MQKSCHHVVKFLCINAAGDRSENINDLTELQGRLKGNRAHSYYIKTDCWQVNQSRRFHSQNQLPSQCQSEVHVLQAEIIHQYSGSETPVKCGMEWNVPSICSGKHIASLGILL